MSLYKMYSVKDELTGKFLNPLFIEQGEMADQLAQRQFKSQLNNIELWKDNPNDYSLYCVGIFSDQTGAEATPIDKICSGRSVLNA